MNKLSAFLSQFGMECLETLALISFKLLLVIGLIGFILAIFGSEKGKKVATLSPVIYVLIQILAKVVCHA